jgi:ribosomal protein L37AE/L43A
MIGAIRSAQRQPRHFVVVESQSQRRTTISWMPRIEQGMCRSCGKIHRGQSRARIWWRCRGCGAINPGSGILAVLAQEPPRRRRRAAKTESKPDAAGPAEVRKVVVRAKPSAPAEPAAPAPAPPAETLERRSLLDLILYGGE